MGPELPYAGFWGRLVSNLLDIMCVAALLCMLDMYLLTNVSGRAREGLELTGLLAVCFYKPMMHAAHGQTYGKRWVKIAVRDITGRPLTKGQVWIRSSVDIALWCVFLWLFMFVWSHLGSMQAGGLSARFNRVRALLGGEGVSQWVSLGRSAWCLWYLADLVFVLFHPRRRAIHELMAGSIVLKVKASEKTASSDKSVGEPRRFG
jgi:uncharacterized RDD family membrane protein YckC